MDGSKQFNQGGSMEDKVSKTLPPGEYDARVEAFKKFAEKRLSEAKAVPSGDPLGTVVNTPIKPSPKVLRPEVRARLPYIDRDDDELVMGEDGKFVMKKELE